VKIFSVKRNIDNSPSDGGAAAVAQMRAQMFRQIIILAGCLVIVTAAAAAFITNAWFAINRRVDSNDGNVVSTTASPSLFIRDAGDSTTAFASTINKTASSALFPISTANLSNWYYASGFTHQSQVVNGAGYSYVVNTPIANSYTAISAFIDEDAGTYLNNYENANKVAYYKSDVNLYTTNGELDVYLDSASPITVSYDAENTSVDAKQLLNCLRVGIAAEGSKVFIYAPVAESGTGNSSGAAANTFYYIQNGTLTAAGTNVVTSLTNYLASKQAGSDVLYEATNGAISLGTADTDGLDVTVYVWLEGTDAQALYGLADEDVKGINVSISYAGVESSGN